MYIYLGWNYDDIRKQMKVIGSRYRRYRKPIANLVWACKPYKRRKITKGSIRMDTIRKKRKRERPGNFNIFLAKKSIRRGPCHSQCSNLAKPKTILIL